MFRGLVKSLSEDVTRLEEYMKPIQARDRDHERNLLVKNKIKNKKSAV